MLSSFKGNSLHLEGERGREKEGREGEGGGEGERYRDGEKRGPQERRGGILSAACRQEEYRRIRPAPCPVQTRLTWPQGKIQERPIQILSPLLQHEG